MSTIVTASSFQFLSQWIKLFTDNWQATRVSYKPNELNIHANPGSFIRFENGANFVFQEDGNLVVYNNGKPLWAAGSNVHGGNKDNLILRFQDDGNLVQYLNNSAKWSTKTAGKGVKLVISDSTPFLIILDKNGNIAWHSTQDVKP